MGRKANMKKQRRDGVVVAPELRVEIEEPRAPAILDKPMRVSDATFDREVIESELPVLVDFWAPWCGPCKAIAPVLEEIAASMAGRLKIVKYDTQANQRVATAMGIRSIPTLVIFKDGEVADVQIGAVPRERLERWIERTVTPRKSLLARAFGMGRAEA